MEKKIEYYLNLPYTRELIPEPEGGWFVRIKELPGCMSQGDTPDEAMEMIADAMEGWLEVAMDHGRPIPEPRVDDGCSGKFVLRVPKSMHRKLVVTASDEGVSLNQWIVSVVSEAVSEITGGKRQYIPNKETDVPEELNWPGLSNAIEAVLKGVGMQYQSNELDEKVFSVWLGQNLDVVRSSIQRENFSQAVSLNNALMYTLEEHKVRSPLMHILCQLVSDEINVLKKADYLKHVVSKSEKLHSQIQSLIDDVNAQSIIASQSKELESFYLKTIETENRLNQEEKEESELLDGWKLNE